MRMDRAPHHEPRALAAALRRMLRGEPASPGTIGVAAGLTPEEVEAALDALDAAGAPYRRDGRVVAAYPLSGIPTRHRITLRRATTYANCAVDALAVPFVVDDPVAIDSECVQCGTAITVRTQGERILAAQPRAPVVYVVSEACCEPGPAVLTRCPHINFFCSQDHGDRWQAVHTGRPGTILTLDEAIARARERFAPVVRAFRGGDVALSELSRRASATSVSR
jgi:hypothetical protein